MQERREDFVIPPADEELVFPHPSCSSYNQPETTTGGDRLMDAIHSVLERINEDNFPLVEETRMLNYEPPMRREIDFRTGDERGGGSIFQTGTSWMMTLGDEEEEKFVERIAKKVEERITNFLDNRIQKLLEELLMPLRQRSMQPKIKATVQVQPPHDENKCDANHSGAKRKAVLPLEQVVYESTSTGVPKKTLNEDWSCALCQVTATSKHGLDDHFKGKKHKLNESAMRLKNERKNFENRLSLKNKAACDASYLCEAKQKSVSPPEHVVNEFTSTGVAIIASEDLSCAICQFSATSKLAFDAHLQGTKHKSKEADLRIVTKNQDNGLLRKEEANQRENDMKGYSTSKTIEGDKKSSKHGKKKSMIWCDICCVGVTSEVAMELHRKGKNHLKLLKDVPIQNIVESCVNVDADEVVVGVEVKDKDDSTFENVEDMECGCDNSLKVDDIAAEVVVGVKDMDTNS